MITYMFSNLDNVPSHFPPVAESRYKSRPVFSSSDSNHGISLASHKDSILPSMFLL